MLKKLSFLNLLFSLLIISAFSGKLSASEISSFDYLLTDFANESLFADASEFIDPFLVTRAQQTTYYILYARPGGALGDQVRAFWKDVKNEELDNPPVLNYPPHITLTGFFPIKNSLTEKNLISALKGALKNVGIIPITIQGTIIAQEEDIDYIPFENSPILHNVALDFLSRAKVSSSYIRPKPKSSLGYHLTLRQNTDSKTTLRVRELEQEDIHLDEPQLQANTTWALYIYKKIGSNGDLKLVYKQSIKTQ